MPPCLAVSLQASSQVAQWLEPLPCRQEPRFQVPVMSVLFGWKVLEQPCNPATWGPKKEVSVILPYLPTLPFVSNF